jgi:DNA-binding response OmpR family regulator
MAPLLVVDDDPEMLLLLRRSLAVFGGHLEASNGEDALRLVRSEHPRLVLLDVTMPGMDGIVILRKARLIDPSISVVMLTGGYDVAVAKQALDGGARAYITKPFNEVYLRAEVRRLLEGDEARDRADASSRPWRVMASGATLGKGVCP